MNGPKGKGGNIVTTRNPFQSTATQKGSAPSLSEATFLGQAVDKLLDAGCAIIIGRTRDGGAVVLTVLDGDERHRTYCSTEVELDNAIAAISDIYDK